MDASKHLHLFSRNRSIIHYSYSQIQQRMWENSAMIVFQRCSHASTLLTWFLSLFLRDINIKIAIKHIKPIFLNSTVKDLVWVFYLFFSKRSESSRGLFIICLLAGKVTQRPQYGRYNQFLWCISGLLS